MASEKPVFLYPQREADSQACALLQSSARPDVFRCHFGADQYWEPYIPTFDEANLRYLTLGGFKAKRLYDQDLIRALIKQGAPLDAVFAYDLTDAIS